MRALVRESQARQGGQHCCASTGRASDVAQTVVFHGGPGNDRRLVREVAAPVSDTRIRVRVPAGGDGGPDLRLRRSRARIPAHRRPIRSCPRPRRSRTPTLTPVPGPRQAGAPRLETGRAARKAFFGARRAVTFSFRVSERLPGGAPRRAVVRAADGAVAAEPGRRRSSRATVQSVAWNGKRRRPSAAPRGRLLLPPDRLARRAAPSRAAPRPPTSRATRSTSTTTSSRSAASTTTAARARASAPAVPATATRATTSSPAAAPAWSRRAAVACSSPATTARPATTSSSTAAHRHRLRLHAPGRADAFVGATGSTPASRSGRRRHRQRQRLPPALRDVERRPAGTRAVRRSIRCPSLKAWDAYS